MLLSWIDEPITYCCKEGLTVRESGVQFSQSLSGRSHSPSPTSNSTIAMSIDSLHLEYKCCASHLLHQWTFPSVWAEVDWAEAVTILGYLCICVTLVVMGRA